MAARLARTGDNEIICPVLVPGSIGRNAPCKLKCPVCANIHETVSIVDHRLTSDDYTVDPSCSKKLNLLQYKTFACTYRRADARSARRELGDRPWARETGMKIFKAVISGALALTSAQSEASGAPAQATFTGAQIWAMLTEAINLPDGEVTPTRIASIFGAPPHADPPPPTPPYDNVRSYIVHAGTDSLFDIFFYLHGDTGAFQFSFDWGQLDNVVSGARFNLPNNLCITRETVVTTMKARGWQTLASVDGDASAVITSTALTSPAVVPPPPVIVRPRDLESLEFTLAPSRSAKAYFPTGGQCLVLLAVMRRGQS